MRLLKSSQRSRKLGLRKRRDPAGATAPHSQIFSYMSACESAPGSARLLLHIQKHASLLFIAGSARFGQRPVCVFLQVEVKRSHLSLFKGKFKIQGKCQARIYTKASKRNAYGHWVSMEKGSVDSWYLLRSGGCRVGLVMVLVRSMWRHFVLLKTQLASPSLAWQHTLLFSEQPEQPSWLLCWTEVARLVPPVWRPNSCRTGDSALSSAFVRVLKGS